MGILYFPLNFPVNPKLFKKKVCYKKKKKKQEVGEIQCEVSPDLRNATLG